MNTLYFPAVFPGCFHVFFLVFLLSFFSFFTSRIFFKKKQKTLTPTQCYLSIHLSSVGVPTDSRIHPKKTPSYFHDLGQCYYCLCGCYTRAITLYRSRYNLNNIYPGFLERDRRKDRWTERVSQCWRGQSDQRLNFCLVQITANWLNYWT